MDVTIFDEVIDVISGIDKTRLNASLVDRQNRAVKGDGFRIEQYVIKSPGEDQYPKRTVFFPSESFFSNSLLVSASEEDLITDPTKVWNGEFDFCLLTEDGKTKWMKYQTFKELPKRYICQPSKPFYPTLCHFREYSESGRIYLKSWCAYKKGILHPAHSDFKALRRTSGNDVKGDSASYILATSLIEQACSAWTIEISLNERSVIVPGYEEDIKELADVREGPKTPSERRKAILHWVTTHIRKTKKKTVNVSAHTRGIESFDIDDFQIQISIPLPLMLEHHNPEKFKGSLPYHMMECMTRERVIENVK